MPTKFTVVTTELIPYVILIEDASGLAWDDTNSVLAAYVSASRPDFAFNLTQLDASNMWIGSVPTQLAENMVWAHIFGDGGTGPLDADTHIETQQVGITTDWQLAFPPVPINAPFVWSLRRRADGGVSAAEIIRLQPADEKILAFDFANLLAPGAQLISTPAPVITEETQIGGLVFGTPAVVGKQVQVNVSAVVDGTSYRVAVRVNTSLGEVVNGDGVLKGLAKDDVPST